MGGTPPSLQLGTALPWLPNSVLNKFEGSDHHLVVGFKFTDCDEYISCQQVSENLLYQHMGNTQIFVLQSHEICLCDGTNDTHLGEILLGCEHR